VDASCAVLSAGTNNSKFSCVGLDFTADDVGKIQRSANLSASRSTTSRANDPSDGSGIVIPHSQLPRSPRLVSEMR
jgi:hypothetical protein